MTASFLIAGDELTHKLAYAIALKYGQYTNDYNAAIDIANKLHYYPVVKLLESRSDTAREITPNVDSILNKALSETYRDGYYKTEQQYFLSRIVSTQENITAIAPTSYGKSNMILEKVLSCHSSGKTVCILAPTKALISQTLREIISLKGDRRNIIVHPDATFDETSPLITIFTQERLSTFLIRHPNKKFDYIFVDEAHNIMSNDERSLTLSRSIIIAKIRNPTISIDFSLHLLSAQKHHYHLFNLTMEKSKKDIPIKLTNT